MNASVLTDKLIRSFGDSLRANEKSDFTIDKYIRDARAFLKFADGRPLSRELTAAYKNALIRGGEYADSSINSMLASLRGLFRFLGRGDCIVASIRIQQAAFCPESKSLSMKEYQRLLKAAEGKRRLRMILRVLFSTGIRVSELEYFTVEAVRKASCVRVSGKKKNRSVILPGNLRKELLRYAGKMGIKSGRLFRTRSGRPVNRSNLWRQMKGLCREAGVDREKVFPHNLRKLFARTFYQGAHDIAQLACLLGHSSINTTMIYVRTTEEEVRARVESALQSIP